MKDEIKIQPVIVRTREDLDGIPFGSKIILEFPNLRRAEGVFGFINYGRRNIYCKEGETNEQIWLINKRNEDIIVAQYHFNDREKRQLQDDSLAVYELIQFSHPFYKLLNSRLETEVIA